MYAQWLRQEASDKQAREDQEAAEQKAWLDTTEKLARDEDEVRQNEFDRKSREEVADRLSRQQAAERQSKHEEAVVGAVIDQLVQAIAGEWDTCMNVQMQTQIHLKHGRPIIASCRNNYERCVR